MLLKKETGMTFTFAHDKFNVKNKETSRITPSEKGNEE